MELIIKIMATKDMNFAQALREYYIGKGKGSQHRAAKQMGLSVRQYQNHFKAAFAWLEGWFAGQYAAYLVKMAVKEKYNHLATPAGITHT